MGVYYTDMATTWLDSEPRNLPDEHYKSLVRHLATATLLVLRDLIISEHLPPAQPFDIATAVEGIADAVCSHLGLVCDYYAGQATEQALDTLLSVVWNPNLDEEGKLTFLNSLSGDVIVMLILATIPEAPTC